MQSGKTSVLPLFCALLLHLRGKPSLPTIGKSSIRQVVLLLGIVRK
jgi:hypothetical protein